MKSRFAHWKTTKSGNFGDPYLGNGAKWTSKTLCWYQFQLTNGANLETQKKINFQLFYLLCIYMRFWVKTLRPKFPGFQIRSGLAWDRDFQTQSQYVTICCPILHARDGEFYSIHYICFGFLKSEFSHCKSVKTWELWGPLSRERSEFNFRNTLVISIPINIWSSSGNAEFFFFFTFWNTMILGQNT